MWFILYTKTVQNLMNKQVSVENIFTLTKRKRVRESRGDRKRERVSGREKEGWDGRERESRGERERGGMEERERVSGR